MPTQPSTLHHALHIDGIPKRRYTQHDHSYDHRFNLPSHKHSSQTHPWNKQYKHCSFTNIPHLTTFCSTGNLHPLSIFNRQNYFGFASAHLPTHKSQDTSYSCHLNHRQKSGTHRITKTYTPNPITKNHTHLTPLSPTQLKHTYYHALHKIHLSTHITPHSPSRYALYLVVFFTSFDTYSFIPLHSHAFLFYRPHAPLHSIALATLPAQYAPNGTFRQNHGVKTHSQLPPMSTQRQKKEEDHNSYGVPCPS